ncbi:MAG: YaiI/YqxD family protein [Candidatus Eisenbacteria bacterium]|nr:YaiI/YqxD family protein [Candidatus Eisenbacteria bacterium]
MSGELRILVDADACPVKPEVYRVAERFALPVVLVADQWMRVPDNERITLVVVARAFDAADDRIVELADESAIVITADIPLAARCIDKGASVLSPTGRPFTEDNIGDTLATRNLLADLRGAGEVTGGPAPFGDRDRSRFLQALDTMVHAVRRRREGRR